MRVAVVDDHASQLEGRIAWLSRCADVEAFGMAFEEAAAYTHWEQVQVVVLDGHDRRSPEHRRIAAAAKGVPALPDHDNFAGVRVAEAIRRQSPSDRTTIVMISAHARDSAVRARRIAQAGVDYVFEHYEVERDERAFVQAVLHPDTVPVGDAAIDWASHGYLGVPDIAGAVAAVEQSSAGRMLLYDQLGKHAKDQAWAFRALRKRLHRLLRARVPTTSSSERETRSPRKEWLVAQFRQAFGRDLPSDPS